MITLAPWYSKQREQPFNNMLAHHFTAFTNNANDKMTQKKFDETNPFVRYDLRTSSSF